MSHYYGRLQGAGRREVTRRGHKTTGLRVTAQTWTVTLCIQLEHCKGRDWVVIRASTPHGRHRILHHGPLEDVFLPIPAREGGTPSRFLPHPSEPLQDGGGTGTA